MAGFEKKFKTAVKKERSAALKKRERNISAGVWIQFTLTAVCLWQAARYAYTMNDSDGGARLGGWEIDYAGYYFLAPSISVNALLMVLAVIAMVASGTFFAARLPELFARLKLAETKSQSLGVVLVILMHMVAVGSSSAVSLYTSQSIIQFSSQAASDESLTAGDKAQAALNLKQEIAEDIESLEADVLDAKAVIREAGVGLSNAGKVLQKAEEADAAYVARVKTDYPKKDHGWLLLTDHSRTPPPRKPLYDAILLARSNIVVAHDALKESKALIPPISKEIRRLKAKKIAATAQYSEAIKAPNSVQKSLEEQGKMYGGVSPERVNLVISQIASLLIEFFRITMSITSQTSLAGAIISFTVSEYNRRSKEALAEHEAEDRARRMEEATMAPVRAKEAAHLRVAEAHAERIYARTDASVEAIRADEDPDDWICNTDAVAALEERPEDDSLSIPPMPSGRALKADGPMPFSAMMAIDSVDGYDDLSDFYQDAVRRAEQSWRSGTHCLTASAISSDYGIKSDKARRVFFRWLEEAGRAVGKDTPIGRKYTKVRLAA